MKIIKKFEVFLSGQLLAVLISPALHANENLVRYSLDSKISVKNMYKFSIPYSMGVHEGYAKKAEAEIVTGRNNTVKWAQFKIPIAEMTTKNSTRDCHMREALGIDYSSSVYPKEHVCNSSNQIPEAGPDAIKYENIIAEFVGMALPVESGVILGTPFNSSIKLNISVHGQSKLIDVPVTIVKKVSEDKHQGYRITSNFNLNIADFGVKVKSFEMGFFKISVKDHVTLMIDLHLIESVN